MFSNVQAFHRVKVKISQLIKELALKKIRNKPSLS